jgi:hypothetical protein
VERTNRSFPTLRSVRVQRFSGFSVHPRDIDLVRHRPSTDPRWMKKFCACGDLERVFPFFFVETHREINDDCRAVGNLASADLIDETIAIGCPGQALAGDCVAFCRSGRLHQSPHTPSPKPGCYRQRRSVSYSSCARVWDSRPRWTVFDSTIAAATRARPLARCCWAIQADEDDGRRSVTRWRLERNNGLDDAERWPLPAGPL